MKFTIQEILEDAPGRASTWIGKYTHRTRKISLLPVPGIGCWPDLSVQALVDLLDHWPEGELNQILIGTTGTEYWIAWDPNY